MGGKYLFSLHKCLAFEIFVSYMIDLPDLLTVTYDKFWQILKYFLDFKTKKYFLRP